MLKRLFSLLMMLFLLASTALPTFAALTAEAYPYGTPPELMAKIQSTRDFGDLTKALGMANVKLYQMRHAGGGEQALDALTEQIAHLREMLLKFKAYPSDERLAELGQAALIGDETVDVWGKFHLIDDHEVYELVIMDRLSADSEPRYAATLTQDDFAITCSALTTVHLFYVRPASGGDWRKTLTTNAVSVAEIRDLFISSVEAKGEHVFADRLTPDGFDDRLTRAVAAYGAGAPVVDLLESYTATVTLDGEEVELYTLDFALPDTREWGMIVILGSLGIVVAAGLVVAFLFGRSRRAQ